MSSREKAAATETPPLRRASARGQQPRLLTTAHPQDAAGRDDRAKEALDIPVLQGRVGMSTVIMRAPSPYPLRRLSRRLCNTAAYGRIHGGVVGSAQRAGAVAALLLQKIVTTLPPETHVLVLRHLPKVELARLSCVHKSFHVAWRSLQEQQPGERYAPPSADDLRWVCCLRRLVRAATFGNAAVIRSMVAAGVDEHGTPLLEALASEEHRVVDQALWRAAGMGHVQAVVLLLGSGSNVHAFLAQALLEASKRGHADVVRVLIQHGANVHARIDHALRWASRKGHTDVVQLLLQHGADVQACDNWALTEASWKGHAAVVQLLLLHGADVHVHDGAALEAAAREGHAAVVQLLLHHGANVHAKNEQALRSASENGRADVVQLLMQHGADARAV